MTEVKLTAITPEAIDKAIKMAGDKAPFLERLLVRGIGAFVEEDNGDFLAILGVFPDEFQPDVFNVWIIPAERFGVIPRAPLIVKAALNDIIEQLKPRRVQTTAVDDPKIKRWLEWLGFEYEGRMRAAGPGGVDLLMYGRSLWE